MPVLEPVVATLIANTEAFTAQMIAAKAEMRSFAAESSLAGDAALAGGLGDGAAGLGAGEKEARGVEGAVKDVGSAAEKSGGKFSLFGALASQVGGPLGEVRQKTSEFTEGMEKAGRGSEGLIGKIRAIPIPMLAAGAGIAAVGVIGIHMAENMEAATNKIAASEGITTDAAAKIGQAFLTTAGHTTFSAQQISTSFAGIAGQAKEINGGTLSAKQSLDLMKASMDLAEESGTSLDGATSVVAKTLQGFRMGIGDARGVADILTTSAHMTGQSVSTIGNALARVHSQLGVASPSLKDMSSLMVDMTEHGITGRGAISALGQSLGSLASPTAAVSAEQARLGISFLDASGKLKPLNVVLDQAKGAIQGMTQAQGIAELKALGFGSASRKLYAVVEGGGAVFDKVKEKVGEHNAAQVAAEKATNGFKASLEKAKVALEDAGTAIGQKLMPFVTKLAQGLAAAAAWVTDHWPEIMAIIKKGVDFVKPVFEILAKAIEATFKWLIEHKPVLIAVLAAIGIAIGVAFFPFTAIAIGIIALVALIIKAWEPVKNFFIKIWEAIYDFFKPIIPLLKAGMDELIGIFKIAWSIIETVIMVVWDAIMMVVRVAWTIISDFIKFAIAIFTGNWSAAWNAIKGVFTGVWNAITDFVIQVWNAIQNFFVGAFNTFVSMWKEVWNGIKDFLSGIWGQITGVFTGAIKWLWNAGSDIFTGLWNGIKWVWGEVTGWFGSLAKTAEDLFMGAITWLYDIGKKIITGLWNGLKDAWHDVTGWLGNVGGWITNLKGPPEKDATLLTENGRLIMRGFARGLQGGWDDHVAPTLSGMTTAIGGGIGGSLGISGGVSSLNIGNAATSTMTLQVTTPIQIDGRTLATTVTQYQLQNARATGTVLGQYSGGSQTGAATGLNTNAISR